MSASGIFSIRHRAVDGWSGGRDAAGLDILSCKCVSLSSPKDERRLLVLVMSGLLDCVTFKS